MPLLAPGVSVRVSPTARPLGQDYFAIAAVLRIAGRLWLVVPPIDQEQPVFVAIAACFVAIAAKHCVILAVPVPTVGSHFVLQAIARLRKKTNETRIRYRCTIASFRFMSE